MHNFKNYNWYLKTHTIQDIINEMLYEVMTGQCLIALLRYMTENAKQNSKQYVLGH